MSVKKKSKKEEMLLKTAKELFWKFGFRRVTVEEICTTAKVSKMTFYRLYENKTELAKAILDIAIDEGNTNFKSIMRSESNAVEKIEQIMLQKTEGVKDISMEFLNDLYLDPDSELKSYIFKKSAESWNEIVQEFKDAQAKGVFREDFKPEIILSVGYKLIDLLNDEKVVSLYPSPKDLIMEFAKLITYGITPNQH